MAIQGLEAPKARGMSQFLREEKRQTAHAVLQDLGINQAQTHVGMVMGTGVDVARVRNSTG
ncbi:MAG: hypothetical protein ABI618_16230 [Nitrospirota bacterium]